MFIALENRESIVTAASKLIISDDGGWPELIDQYKNLLTDCKNMGLGILKSPFQYIIF